jgi:hypothetical protein
MGVRGIDPDPEHDTKGSFTDRSPLPGSGTPIVFRTVGADTDPETLGRIFDKVARAPRNTIKDAAEKTARKKRKADSP